MSFIYLHGFASSPNSAKAKYLRDRFSEIHIDLKIPDLNAGDFSSLTITRQIQQVAAEFPIDNVTLIGSSLGGLTAAFLGEYPQVQRLVLLAPAFGFVSHFLPSLGEETVQRWQQEKYLMVHHYGEKRELPIHYDLISDALQYQEEKLQRSVPTLIFHGIHDTVIPAQVSCVFARSRPWVELIKLESDHALSDVMAEIWLKIKMFCQLL
jgi:hypothetical protein